MSTEQISLEPQPDAMIAAPEFDESHWVEELSTQPAQVAVARLIEHAVDSKASDLFFSCADGEIIVSMRCLSIVQHVGRLPWDFGVRCLAYMRTMCEIKLEERRRPQDGRWRFALANGKLVDLRVNTIPTLHGESFAIRILLRDSHLQQWEALGFVGPQVNTLRSILNSPGGLVLVTGPTGSGKTTTLYAFLHALNDGRRKIHTLEDPIEYAVRGLHQTQVLEFHGADFHDMLRGVIRQSPDVIMIGEVRDRPTAETAVRAANSGQLVFATLHSTRAAGAIYSLLNLGAPPYFVASSLRAVIGQRLIRTLSQQNRVQIDLSHATHIFEEVSQWLEGSDGQTVYAAQPGLNPAEAYSGQTGIYEILTATQVIRQLIEEGASADAIASKALEEGMFDFRRASLLQIAKGVTSFDEAQRVVPMSEAIGT
jgi:type II secretory ATPase GspE/PulE/Tfp pilus assembly ATPase PilB-like protein